LPTKIKTYLKPALVASIVFSTLMAFFISGAEKMPPLAGSMQKFILNQRVTSAPRIAFRDPDGNEKVVSDFRGQALLINFWATWCAPCIRELPSLARLQTQKKSSKFTVLAVSTDLKGKKIAAPFLERLNLTSLPLYLDSEMEFARSLGVKTLPTTILIDRTGNVVGSLVGLAEWDSAEALALIDYFRRQ
jgi:thiol-disulfide isomerase/thioredoxin